MPALTISDCRIALKEWAVAVRALDAGKQILILRKGGIREEGKEFRVRSPHFFLYPTYEHQRADLLKEAFHPDLHATLAEGIAEATVTLSHWAQVYDVIEVSDQSQVDAFLPYHIWTTDYAQKRLHWKPRKPLLVMLLRVYRIARPKSIPVLPAYTGCTSWVELDQNVPLGTLEPVLPDEAFQRHVSEARRALGPTPARL